MEIVTTLVKFRCRKDKMMIAYYERNIVTAWDLYNAATDMYKSTQLDQPMILSQNLAMSSFIQNKLI